MKKRWNQKTLRALAQRLKPADAHPNSLGKMELGEALGIHRNTISNWFAGKYFPTPDTEKKLECVAKTHSFDPTKVR